jgi:AcrR family transcriptional regulator
MSLYRYFATKDALIDALLDRVISGVPEPAATGDWLEDLREIAFAHARALIEHPWAVEPLHRHASPGLGTARIGESVLDALARGGIVGTDAVAALSAILALNYGWAAIAAPHRSADEVAAGIRELPPGAFPRSIEAAAELARYAGQANYERALEMLLAGVGGASPR